MCTEIYIIKKSNLKLTSVYDFYYFPSNTFYTITKALYYLILPITNVPAPPLKITQLRL